MTSLKDVGMRYQRASLGKGELQQMRDFQEGDPRVEFMSVFPVSSPIRTKTISDAVARCHCPNLPHI